MVGAEGIVRETYWASESPNFSANANGGKAGSESRRRRRVTAQEQNLGANAERLRLPRDDARLGCRKKKELGHTKHIPTQTYIYRANEDLQKTT